MTPAQFHALLKDASGLDVSSVGDSAVGRAVAARQQACALPDRRAYWDHVRKSPAEIQALIEEVVVPETWFFRDDEAFAALARFATEWLQRNASGTLRLLSLPCSTGEEPYSMAMTLLDAGAPASRFRIDAMDISERALGRARHAVYGRNSFRGRQSPHRMRHFTDTAEGRQLRPDVSVQVAFRKGNVLDPSSLPAPAEYDVVFCRNLLIYFDRETQARAVAALSRLLKPGGLIFVGSSEAGILLSQSFVNAGGPMAFGFHQPALKSSVRAGAPVLRRRAPSATPSAPIRRPAAVAAAPTTPAIAADADVLREGLDQGMHLANLGRFVEAAASCEAHIRQHGPSSDAFHLLGLVRDACGNAADAAMYYRKALYLNPRHEEALMHLALLLDTQQQGPEAQRLRSRARRAAKQQAQEA